MIVKAPDSKQAQLNELNLLLERGDLSTQQRENISSEIYRVKQGEVGEQNSAYEVDFYLKDSKNWMVIHDLRIEHNGRVAQIDHLLINRMLEVYVIETKNFNADLEINDSGEFTAIYPKKKFGIPSPLAQNEKHIVVLKDLSKTLPLPTRLGVTLHPDFISVVMVSKNQRISRPQKYDTKNVIKADGILEWITKTNAEDVSFGRVFGGLAKFVSSDTLQDVAEVFTRHHRPHKTDYIAKFGLARKASASGEKPDVDIEEPKSGMVNQADSSESSKLTSSKLASKLGFKNTQELINQLVTQGLVEFSEGKPKLTASGKAAGGEAKFSPKFGPYFIWPENLLVPKTPEKV
ncbi:nuclease-related domain-containing protein [Chitinibacter fontanus]|uniref:nuclease-related domain-containing protein n=1 Tax=Chitinibacter fontanus TaxID=1737446 RepID=UPI001D157825|nr:nuclease-related domain-containing protein [Chitinibacter fontanus]